ncbi:MAG: 50S ribosomal protein L24 [Candidatus Zixiibacteriota bacterium]
MNIKKGDTVYVISGNSKGKTAKVLHVFPESNRLIAEGVHMMKRHTRPTQRNQKGGIISKEGTINRSNVKLYCGSCNSPTRVAYKLIDSKGEGKSKAKTRCCKLCGAEL